MKRISFGLLFGLILGILTVSPAHGEPLTLTVQPSSVSGAAGTLVGWGFTLDNSSDDFAIVSSSDFCDVLIGSPCSTPLGIYTDFIASSFTVIAPHSSLSEVFNAASATGLGSYLIDAAASAGASFLGQIVLTYDLFDTDPNSPDFNPDPVSVGNLAVAPASISVASVSAVPEPATLVLLSSGMGLLFFVKKCRV